ncbi:MAG TPA: hypothetical protein VFU05_07365 [Cyclobacteriaceae bacterium]|nr:hypothetical protein [Cyclobacteriaceae bacterium]
MNTYSERRTQKNALLETSIQKQQSLIADLTGRIKDLLHKEGLGNEDEFDNNVRSQEAQEAREIDSLNKELQFAKEELDTLRYLGNFRETIHCIAEPGAVVETDRSTFFISVSTEQLKVNGKTIIGISTGSPLYQAMKGKQSGQKFHCKGIDYKVVNIY